jgi:UDP-GlcNAc:undecaprenyl-phosphate GlcNAc-1-phosphate transferase
MRRARGRRPVFHADKQHIHHWLLGMARSHRQAVLVMYLWSLLLAAATLVLALGPGLVWRIVSIGIAGVLVASVVYIPRRLRRGRAFTLVPAGDVRADAG